MAFYCLSRACCCVEDALDLSHTHALTQTLHDIAQACNGCAALSSAPSCSHETITLLSAVVEGRGEVLAVRAEERVNPRVALSLIPALTRAAAQHASLHLGAGGVPAMHVRGERLLVSCFEHRGTTAVIITELPPASTGVGVCAGVDTAAMDASILPLMARLHAHTVAVLEQVGDAPHGPRDASGMYAIVPAVSRRQ